MCSHREALLEGFHRAGSLPRHMGVHLDLDDDSAEEGAEGLECATGIGQNPVPDQNHKHLNARVRAYTCTHTRRKRKVF